MQVVDGDVCISVIGDYSLGGLEQLFPFFLEWDPHELGGFLVIFVGTPQF